jgi:hypothetical protein
VQSLDVAVQECTGCPVIEQRLSFSESLVGTSGGVVKYYHNVMEYSADHADQLQAEQANSEAQAAPRDGAATAILAAAGVVDAQLPFLAATAASESASASDVQAAAVSPRGPRSDVRFSVPPRSPSIFVRMFDGRTRILDGPATATIKVSTSSCYISSLIKC